MTKDNKNQEKVRDVPLKWGANENVPVYYANQLFIGHTNNEFYLVFGDVQVPLLINPSKAEIPKELIIKPVARVMLTPNAMQEFTKAMNINLSSYLNMNAQEDTEDDE